MLDNGILEHSVSPWASPGVLVNKPYKTMRLCIDYRNSVLSKIVIPSLIYKMFRIFFTEINGLLHLNCLKVIIKLLSGKKVGGKQFLSHILDYTNTDIHRFGYAMPQPYFKGF